MRDVASGDAGCPDRRPQFAPHSINAFGDDIVLGDARLRVKFSRERPLPPVSAPAPRQPHGVEHERVPEGDLAQPIVAAGAPAVAAGQI